MRVATPTSEKEAKEVVKGLNHAGWKKIVKKAPKQSQTLFKVLKHEYVGGGFSTGSRSGGKEREEEEEAPAAEEKLPVTRVELTPITGRTHQLRVHCAAIGHPILGDPTYGILGEASPNGGLFDENDNDDDRTLMDSIIPTRASTTLQMKLDTWVKDTGQVMCLHARKLQLDHPSTGEEMIFEQVPKF